MYSIKKWIVSKINPSNEENGEFGAEPGRSNAINSNYLEQSSSQQLPFDVSSGAKTILQFYYSDDELNMIASELESFDGRRDPLRCTELVSQLRIAQDKVMQLLFQLMDEWNCTRASRDYRLKFPEDLLNDSENGESFNGQIWFSAECLASGSDIMNHEAESDMLRPIAKILTNNLDQLRIMLRQSSNEITNKAKFYQDLIHRMEQFDRMFSAFEFEYVKAMLPIKSVEDIEKQQELTVLFSESLGFALKRHLITQIDVDEFNPSVMIALPRLAIVHGLVRCGNDNPLFRRHKHNLSNMFKSYHRQVILLFLKFECFCIGN